MEHYNIYHLSIFAGAILMLAYSMLSLLTIDSSDNLHSGFNTSKKILGTTLALWAIYLMYHFALSLRYTNNNLAISVSLATYFMLASGLEMSLHSMLDDRYFSWSRVIRELSIIAIYNIVIAANYFICPQSIQHISILILSTPLIAKIGFAAKRAYKRYCDAVTNIDNYYSDDTSRSVVWMRNSILIMLSLGFSSIFITYGSPLIDAVTMLLAMAAMTYVMISIYNYMASSSNVNNAINTTTPTTHENPSTTLESAIEGWISDHKFTKSGITIEELAKEIKSNRTYISDYINKEHKLTFRNWIAKLRIQYAQQLLIKHPDYPIARIAEMSGYARSSFVSVFTKESGTPPTLWREENLPR